MRYLMVLFLFLSACGRADLSKSVKAEDGRDGLNGTGGACKEVVLDNGDITLVCDGKVINLSQISREESCYPQSNQDGSITFHCQSGTFVIPPSGGDNPGQSTPGERGPRGPSGQDGKDSCVPKLWVDEGRCLWYQCGDTTKKLFDLKHL